MLFDSETSTATSEMSESDAVDSELVNIGVIIDQFAYDVVDVSSQFGSDFSISYVAHNILAKPSKFPQYGDFPETFAFRTYGDWWQQRSLRSRQVEFMTQNLPALTADDFVVLQFEEYVFPEAIRIYETYNPGAVIRIWAYTIAERWSLLWEAKEFGLDRIAPRARMFSPTIRRIGFPCRIIRLEYNHSRLEYFTEIDAVVLVGRKYNLQQSHYKNLLKRKQTAASSKGPIQKRLEMVRFQPHVRSDQEKTIEEFFKYDFKKFEQEAGLLEDEQTPEKLLGLNDLPYEILFKILSFLDLNSLFRTAQVCRNLYDVATDPLLYTEVNLKPYWHLTNSGLLQTLTRRGQLMRKLDLSWCGLFNFVTAGDFKDFIKSNGKSLTHLRLNSCKFLNSACIELVGTMCSNLRELSLRNCYPSNGRDFIILSRLTNLEKLDLFRCGIETIPLLNILRNNRQLKHLNLGLSNLSVNMDEVAMTISRFNKEIVSVDFWKSHSFTSAGLLALAECDSLEEVDFGWCLREEFPPTEALLMLLKGCPNLKKLFLAAIRGLTDRDLENIYTYCPNLEQLDLMGIFGITTDKVEELLEKCTNLQMVDLSFCNQLDEIRVALWQSAYNVRIKRTVNVDPMFPF